MAPLFLETAPSLSLELTDLAQLAADRQASSGGLPVPRCPAATVLGLLFSMLGEGMFVQAQVLTIAIITSLSLHKKAEVWSPGKVMDLDQGHSNPPKSAKI